MRIAKNFLSLVLFCLICLLSELSFAQRLGRGRSSTTHVDSSQSGFLFDFGIYYGQSEAAAEPAANNEWNNNTSVYDIKLGYLTASQFYLGAEYSSRHESNHLNVSASSGRANAFGVGYFWDSGFHLRGFYRTNESWGDYGDGKGYQADLGYMINMTSSFYLGVLFSHRQTKFTSNGSIANFESWTRKETFPMITLGFKID